MHWGTQVSRLLDRYPVKWVLAAALELQWDAGLMALNLSVLYQYMYVTSLYRVSTEVLHLVLGQELFPSQTVDKVDPVPWVLRGSIQMAAMRFWHLPVGPGGSGLDTVFHSDDYPGCTQCSPRLSG